MDNDIFAKTNFKPSISMKRKEQTVSRASTSKI